MKNDNPITIACVPNSAFLSGPTRMIAVYRALIASGMSPVLATNGGTYDFVFEQEGVPCTRLGPPMTRKEALRIVTGPVNPVRRYCSTKVLHDRVVNEIAFFRECGAQAVVSEFTLSTALSARAAGIPLLVTHMGSFVPIITECGLFRWSDGFDNLLRDIIPRVWLDSLILWSIGLRNRNVTQMNKVAMRLGITSVRGMVDLVMGDVTLVTDVPEILGISEEDMDAWRPSDSVYNIRPTNRLKYAGAIYGELSGEIPEDVREFLATANTPKVYVALSSTSADRIAQVCSVLESLEVRAVILTTIHEGRLTSSPNILFKRFLPSHRVMPLCDLVIIHGGQGSVQTAIAAGVPMIGIPLQPEQFFNVRQVEHHGAGRCISLRELKKGKLKETIQEMLGDPGYRDAMSRLQRSQASRNGPFEAARKIRRLVT